MTTQRAGHARRRHPWRASLRATLRLPLASHASRGGDEGRTMVGRSRAMLAMLAAVLAACDPTGVGTLQPGALESDADAVVTVPASPLPTTSARTEPTPQPTATPRPEPSKPSGVTFDWYNEAIPGPPADTAGIGDFIVTVTWRRPRTKGTEMRVY